MSGGTQQSHTAWQDCEELRSLGFVKGRLIKRIMHARGWAHAEVRPRLWPVVAIAPPHQSHAVHSLGPAPTCGRVSAAVGPLRRRLAGAP